MIQCLGGSVSAWYITLHPPLARCPLEAKTSRLLLPTLSPYRGRAAAYLPPIVLLLAIQMLPSEGS